MKQTDCWLIVQTFAGIFQFRVAESAKLGSAVGRIQASDRDTGRNAEMFFSIVGGDGMDMFEVSTDRETQEGLLTVSKVS